MSHSTFPRTALFALAAVPFALLGAAPSMAAPCQIPNLWHKFAPEEEGLDPVYDARAAMLALWRPGSGVAPDPELQVGIFGLASRVNQPGDHRSISDFEMYEMDGEQRFALVYSAEEAAEDLTIGLSASHLTELFEDGQDFSAASSRRYLVDLETYRRGGDQRRYAALFVDGIREQSLELQVSGDAIKTRVEDSFVTMRRLVDFELVALPSKISPSPTFIAVFEVAQRAQRFFPQLGADEFHYQIHQQNNQDYRLANVEIWRDPDGKTFYAALFETAPLFLDDHLYALQCTEELCQDQYMVDDVSSHLTFAAGNVAELNPALRLVDLELPLGRTEGPSFFPLASQGQSTRRELPWPRTDVDPEGLIIVVGPPTCHHAGVLHDGGTNGPPPWY